MRTKLEYIWLDGYFPTQNMRSKTKVVEDFDYLGFLPPDRPELETYVPTF